MEERMKGAAMDGGGEDKKAAKLGCYCDKRDATYGNGEDVDEGLLTRILVGMALVFALMLLAFLAGVFVGQNLETNF